MQPQVQEVVLETFKKRYDHNKPGTLGFWLAYAHRKNNPGPVDMDALFANATGVAGYLGLDPTEVYEAALGHLDRIYSNDVLAVAVAMAYAEPAAQPFKGASPLTCQILAVAHDLGARQTEFILPRNRLAEAFNVTPQRISQVIQVLVTMKLLVCTNEHWSQRDGVCKRYSLPFDL